MNIVTFRKGFKLGSWGARGACRRHPTAWWFGGQRPEVARARRICDTCPVNAECLAHAMARPGIDGMWAGTTPEQRAAIHVRDELAHTVRSLE